MVTATVRDRQAAWRRIERLARAARRRDIPLLLIVPGGQREEEASRIAGLHLTRCLPKPVKPSEMEKALARCLGCDDGPAAESSADHDGGRRPGLRILLAEDCEVNQEVAVGLLELRGHEIAVANDGRQAIALMKQNHFDLVLMDVEMPEMDGLEATRAIRRWETAKGRYTPIIAMTAHAIRGFQETCTDAGMDAYLAKPVDPEKLYQLVEKTVRQQRRASQLTRG